MQDDRVIRTQWLIPAVVLLLSFFFPSAGVSQQARMTQPGRLTTLNGSATNAEGEPLSGTTVVARNLATGQTQSDQSDAQGEFAEATEAVGRARTCGGCHRAHRERAEDGSYMMKY